MNHAAESRPPRPAPSSAPPEEAPRRVHCEECQDPDYVPPSPEALAALEAGLKSAKAEPIVYSDEDFTRFADDA